MPTSCAAWLLQPSVSLRSRRCSNGVSFFYQQKKDTPESIPFDEDVAPHSNGGKQRKLAQSKASEVVLTLWQETCEVGIPAQHLLFNSWFCSPRGSAHRHRCTRFMSSATTSSHVSPVLVQKDLTLSEEEIIPTYGKRWNIEVFFKCYLKALASLLSLLIDCAMEAEILDEEQVDQLLGLFVANLHHLWRGKVPETVCVM